jgi:hypothetical protein
MYMYVCVAGRGRPCLWRKAVTYSIVGAGDGHDGGDGDDKDDAVLGRG